MGGPWSATGQAAGTISARPHLPHARLSGDRLRCSWAGPEESHPDLAAHVGPPLPPHQARPAPILPSLDPSRSRSHSEDHRRPLPLTLPAPWTWAQPRPAQLPRAEAPDQVPAAMPSPVRAIPTSTAAATTPSLSLPSSLKERRLLPLTDHYREFFFFLKRNKNHINHSHFQLCVKDPSDLRQFNLYLDK